MKTKVFAALSIAAFIGSCTMLMLPSKTSTTAVACYSQDSAETQFKHNSRFPAQACDQKLLTQPEFDALRKVALTSSTDFQDEPTPEAAPDRRVLVDLKDPKEAMLDSIALIGSSDSEWLGKGWGSGFLVSKCHVITANHVVFHHDMNPDLAEEMKLGKEVTVGFGQTSSAPWKQQRLKGKVIGFNPNILKRIDNTNIYAFGLDFAVIKLSKGPDGKYPTENRKSLCLSDDPIKYLDAKQSEIRSVGHPSNKYQATGKISLWEDVKCSLVGQRSADNYSTWYTNCQARPGMSGGPIATFIPADSNRSNKNCWMPIGIISGVKKSTGGFTEDQKIDKDTANIISPLNIDNIKIIKKVMEDNKCE